MPVRILVARTLGPALASCGLILVTACTGPTQPIAQPSARQLTPANAPGLFVVESRALGPMVVDGQGFVLYRFDDDTTNPPTSRCVDACANEWLAVPAVDDVRVVGIDRQLVGRTRRPDGTMQLTLAGWPLYGYSGDRMPGDTNGQRRDSRWFVIGPNGARVAAGSSVPTAESGSAVPAA